MMDKLPWKHIRDIQPEHDEMIIHLDPPFEGQYPMGMRKYYQNCTWQDIVEYCKRSDIPEPNFWWISAKDFPFPDKKEGE